MTSNELLDEIIDVDFGSNINWCIDALKPNTVLPFYSLMYKQITVKPILVFILPNNVRMRALELVQKALEASILNPLICKIYKLEEIVQAHLDLGANDKIERILLQNNP